MEESLISSWEDAALWCEIFWSCHLSQASLKATETKVCDGPDLLELPFFYVSLHFLLCYTPLDSLLLPFCLTHSLRVSRDCLPLFPFIQWYLTFQQAAGNILITLVFISPLFVYNNTRDPQETRARYDSFAVGIRALIFATIWAGTQTQTGVMRFGYIGNNCEKPWNNTDSPRAHRSYNPAGDYRVT